MSAIVLVTLIVLAGAALLWVGFIQERYSLGGDRPIAIEVITSDGWVIHAHHRAAKNRRFSEPVVLCHGLANNSSFFEFLPPQNLALFLTELGFDTYSVDHRGDANSRAPEWDNDATFDDLVQFDIPAILDVVLTHSNGQRVWWVGHSLGGLAGLASAAVSAKIAGVCTIGAPVYLKLGTPLRYLLRATQWLSPTGIFPIDFWSRVVAPLAARVKLDSWLAASANIRNIDAISQRALMAHVISPLWRGVMWQLEDWALNDVFRSRDGKTDYRAQAAALQIPILVMAGTVDGLATLEGSRSYFEMLTTSDKTFVGLGKEFGQVDDYGHGDLVIGRLAHQEVYPSIGEWLTKHAGPLNHISNAPLPNAFRGG